MKDKQNFKELIDSGKSIVKKEKEGGLIKKPFRTYTLDEDKKDKGVVVITLKLNLEEQAQLVKDKRFIEQSKSGTAIKQLWKIGSKVVLDPKMQEIITTIIGNRRKNKHIGVVDFEK